MVPTYMSVVEQDQCLHLLRDPYVRSSVVKETRVKTMPRKYFHKGCISSAGIKSISQIVQNTRATMLYRSNIQTDFQVYERVN